MFVLYRSTTDPIAHQSGLYTGAVLILHLTRSTANPTVHQCIYVLYKNTSDLLFNQSVCVI